MGDISKDNLLRSWKEIASYLGVDVRTCHRWEDQRGMPVHRAEAAEKKSPVFAYKDELDAWFKGTFKASDTSVIKLKKRSPWLKWALGGTAGVVLVGAFLYEGGFLARQQPADFGIEGSFLVIKDKKGREIGRWDSKLEDLEPEEFYRTHFQVKHAGEGYILPLLIIKDIDGDGDAEVLFAPKRTQEQNDEGRLYCLDRIGKEIWNFQMGRELRAGKFDYSPDYRVSGLFCHDLEGDGRLETVVKAYHAPDWPCQLVVLDADGKIVGEFWNAGYLTDLVFHDITGDGRDELIVVGVNNEYRGGCLAVFDTRRISGASPQTGEYVCEGFTPGSMLYYVTVPYTDVADAMGETVSGFGQVVIRDNDRIEATMTSSLIYEFGFDLACLQVKAGNGFKAHHRDMALAGRITSVLDDAYLEAQRDGVRWWTGSAWASIPSPVRH